ncbi:TetR/AcrR family transcriptional regulator [Alteromonas gracilis]|uniref:TetR/AcrR family transcriptional regulator n=1 Tax=Alteromonas gracilis TaxID=1479524 RepID=UPI0030D2D53E
MKYDRDKVIDKATALFWQRGFQGAGMRDIQQALDMRPGSIYARFQSKEGLFKLVVDKYADNSQQRLTHVIEAESPLKALGAFFEEALMHPNDQRFMRQCLLIKSMTELDQIGTVAKQSVIDGMQKLNTCFEHIVSAAIDKNELPDTTPKQLAADWLQNQFVGLRTFALMHDDANSIRKMIDKVLLDLKHNWPT